MEKNAQFDLVFEKFDIDNNIFPNIQIYYKIILENDGNILNKYIKLETIEYSSELRFLNSDLNPIDNSKLKNEYSSVLKLLSLNNTTIDDSIVINLSMKNFDKIIERHVSGGIIELKIYATVKYEIYEKSNGKYLLCYPDRVSAAFIHDSQHSSSIAFTKEQTKEIIEKNNGNITIPIHIPFNKLECDSDSLSHSLINLKSASDAYTKGNIYAFLINIRNTILNDLTEYSNNNSKSNKKTRILKKGIKDTFLNKIPLLDQRFYKDILNNVENMILALLKNIHKFVHVNSDALLKSPFAADLELMFFSTSLLIRYLCRIIDLS